MKGRFITYNRKSRRLQGFDYGSPGNYFVTIYTKDGVSFFGEVVDGMMILNPAGKVAENCWKEIPQHYPNVLLHQYIIMPNHIHGILEIMPHNGKPFDEQLRMQSKSQETKSKRHKNEYQHIIPGSIGCIIRGFKIGVTKWFRKNTDVHIVWHHNFYDRIIRSPRAFKNISIYIINNPKAWQIKKSADRI